MAVSTGYKAYVLEQLQGAGPVIARAMFGGVGLYRGGVFFGLIADDSLYLKVDDSNRADYEQAGARPFQPYGEKSYSMQYYEVPADVLEDRAQLIEWTAKALAVARGSATAKRKPQRPS
jgi:DNA transformation protein